MSHKKAQLEIELQKLKDELAKSDKPSKKLEGKYTEVLEQIENLESTEGVMVEVARSFAFKLNVGNYQSADFFCSQKSECEWNDAPEVSEALYQFCKADVAKAVNGYKKVLDDARNVKAVKVAKKQEARDTAGLDLGMEEIQINEQ